MRLVEAGGDCCACCGTHLARTGEVGLIKIISFAHYKSGMRLARWVPQQAQQHTGEHILSGALHRLFGAENVGFHIGSPYVRMDTSIPLTQEQLAQAEAEANAAVRADTPVHCWVPDPETLARTDYRSKKELTGDVRLVEAGGDCCACCGTHLARTGEVGLIKIISFAHYKSGMRLARWVPQQAQQHTGEHILSGALHRLFGAENVGFHIGSPYVRMDTSIPLTQEQLAQAEAEANAAVRADTPVHCWVPDPETLARTDYRSKRS